MRMEKNITSMGDFNCNMLPAPFYNANTQALLNITDIYNLKQLIAEPLLTCFFSLLSSYPPSPRLCFSFGLGSALVWQYVLLYELQTKNTAKRKIKLDSRGGREATKTIAWHRIQRRKSVTVNLWKQICRQPYRAWLFVEARSRQPTTLENYWIAWKW